MPKKNTKAQRSNELDGPEFFAAIDLIEKEKGIPKAYMLEKITQALVSAYKRDHEGAGDNVTVEADEAKGEVRMFVRKDVVEVVDNPCTEMSLEEARQKLPRAQLGRSSLAWSPALTPVPGRPACASARAARAPRPSWPPASRCGGRAMWRACA